MAVDDIHPVNSSNMLDIKTERPSESTNTKKSTIHSGHFMVSRVHDVNNDDDVEEATSPFSDDGKGFDFLSASKETSKTYNFGSSEIGSQTVSIDASLTKLFECMTLAYSGKITSPRWKQFRGMHLSQKQRIRLNNLIWREWHMQYVFQKHPMVCHFAMPFSDDIHSKPEAVVLEGKYWKRKLDTVTAEYKKWRLYFKDRIQQQGHIDLQVTKNLQEWELLERVKDVTFIPHSMVNIPSSTDLALTQNDADMDFTNELFFNSLQQPFPFPNPRELSQLGCADLIQPGLIQLQPNLEEFMDIDTMQEFLNAKIPSPAPPDTTSGLDTGQSALQTNLPSDAPEMSLVDFLATTPVNNIGQSNILGGTDALLQNSGNNSCTTPFQGSPSANQNVTLQLAPSVESQGHTTTILVNQSSVQNLLGRDATFGDNGTPIATNQQTLTVVPNVAGAYPNFFGDDTINLTSSSFTPKALNTNNILAQVLQAQQQRKVNVLPQTQTLVTAHPVQQLPQANTHQLLQQQQQQQQRRLSPSSQSPLLAQSLAAPSPHVIVRQVQPQGKALKQKLSSKQAGGASASVNSASGMMSGLAKLAESSKKKKDGLFAVPNTKAAITPRKNRVIRPAPPAAHIQPQPQPQPQIITPSPSSQASYLAELLKNGTYPGALINVKKEVPIAASAARPFKTTTNTYQEIRSSITQQLPTPTLVTIAPAQPVRTTLVPVTAPAIDVSKITSQDLSSMILSAAVSSDLALGSTTTNDTARLPSQPDVKPSQSVSPSAPVSTLLPKSPVSNPVPIKVSVSPSLGMEVGSSSDSVSLFSSMPMSPMADAVDSPVSSDSSFPRDTRRVAHLSAEQKRRCNLKTGFDMLQQLVPSLTQNPKVSKATMLQKTAEFCKKLKSERIQMQKEATILKQEIEALNSAISLVQSQLPETGVPVTRQRKDQMKEMFDEYVRTRTMENWKFWIFSVIMNSLYDSYCNTVSTASLEELCRTALTWLDQSCSLVSLRPNVLNALRKLSKSTSILTEPHKVKDQALQAVSAIQVRGNTN